MTQLLRKQIALIAAALLLFSVLSPAMASVLFSHRPDIMAQVLGVPAPMGVAEAAMQHAAGCELAAPEAPAPMHHGDRSAPLSDAPDHTAHGVVCSFCLAASAGVSLPAMAPALVSFVTGASEVVSSRQGPPPPIRAPSTQQARAPPSLF